MNGALPRVALAVLFSAILVVASVLPAAANGPVFRGALDLTGDTTYQTCGSQIVQTFEKISTRVTVWILDDGTEVDHLQGDAKVTWTNPDSGKSVTLNLSGPGHITFYPDGSIVARWSGQNIPALDGTVWNTQGRIAYTIDKYGIFAFDKITGHAVDVCAALQERTDTVSDLTGSRTRASPSTRVGELA